MQPLLRYAAGLGLDALIEVHTAGELDIALEAGGQIIGVNSRDLDTFKIDLEAAWKILTRIPAECIAVAESGMARVADVQRAAAAGADAVLIGTALSAAATPGGLLRELTGVARRGR